MPSNYEQIVKDFYSRSLFDPYSAVYTFQSPVRGWAGSARGIQYGWYVCGTLNAKNRMGGYVGVKPFYALIRHGSVVDEWMGSMAAQRCANL